MRTDVAREVRRVSRLGEASITLRGVCAGELSELNRVQRLSEIHLEDYRSRALPECLRGLDGIEVLSICGGSLEHLPDWLGEWRRLRRLDVSLADLKELPESVASHPALEDLRARHCKVRRVPDDWSAAVRLVSVSLGGNPLRRFPAGLLRSKARYIALSDCRIRRLPEEGWAAARDLRVLDLACNPIEALPDAVRSAPSLESVTYDAELVRLRRPLGRLSAALEAYRAKSS